MNKYQKELQKLKDWDEVQSVEKTTYGDFIYTAGHGYLIVPRENKYWLLAKQIVKYGFVGKLAVYLEEDCEAPEFQNKLDELGNYNCTFIS